MAQAVITFKIMPDTAEANFDNLEKQALEKIAAFTGNTETKSEIEPIAFGLKALKIVFVMNEAQGSPDGLAQDIEDMNGVMSCETVDVRRAIG